MPSIEVRLRTALLPDYEVHEELASGGMGMVFTARDVELDRLVAIKIIRPDLATAEAAERFLREARVLAQLRHPNVVPVHRAGEAGGFFYYVMDLVEGETLGQRLNRGPLTREETLKLGRDILDALEAVHRLGIVHRDVKPANIFLVGGRALLADFGIARASGPQTVATDSAKVGVAGTPGYMPPEQAFGWEVTQQTDLYAAAMVLFEALSGQRWSIVPEMPSDWTQIPRGITPILRRALDFDPRHRWSDARTFRHALWRTRTTKYRRRTLMLTLSGLAAGAIAGILLFGNPQASPADLLVLPFETEGNVDPQDGSDLARVTHANLVTLDAVGFNVSSRLSEAGVPPAQLLAELNTRAYVSGVLRRSGEGLEVQIALTNRDGQRLEAAPVFGMAVQDFDGCRLASEVVKLATPEAIEEQTCVFGGSSSDAVMAWLKGERAYRQQEWGLAADHYTEAIEYDSTFALAHWRRVTAQRWLRVPQTLDYLDTLYHLHGDQLAEVDQMLLDARRTPFGPERLGKYGLAVRKYPHDPYVMLLLGDDLLMRGSLMGVPLDSAQSVLENATRLDPELGPALGGLVMAAIRLGQQERAREAIGRLQAIAGAHPEVPPEMYYWVFRERFLPDSARIVREQSVQAAAETDLSRFLRWALAFDVPAAQADISQMLLLSDPSLPSTFRASLHVARGLALFALGRVAETIAHFDSVAAALGTTEAQLVAAQWRVFPGAIGLPGVAPADRAAGRIALEALVDDPSLGPRAAWVLALDAYARDADLNAREWAARARADANGEPQDAATLLEGVRLAGAGAFDDALEATDNLIPLHHSVITEPFLRTALHLSRGDWHDREERTAADSEWRWYENCDLPGGWPTGLPEAGEIDWAFTTYARFLRGRAALERNDRATGCPLLRRVLEVWQTPDAALEPFTNEARNLVRRRCSS